MTALHCLTFCWVGSELTVGDDNGKDKRTKEQIVVGVWNYFRWSLRNRCKRRKDEKTQWQIVVGLCETDAKNREVFNQYGGEGAGVMLRSIQSRYRPLLKLKPVPENFKRKEWARVMGILCQTHSFEAKFWPDWNGSLCQIGRAFTFLIKGRLYSD